LAKGKKKFTEKLNF
jgi:hypothetical protein